MSEQLAASLDPATTLATVVHAAVPALADICIADLRGDAAEPARVDVAFSQAVSAEVKGRVMQARDGAGTPHAAALERGQLSLINDAKDHRSATAEASGMAIRSIMYVPIATCSRNLGVLTLISAQSGRAYGPLDLALAEDIGRRAAIAIDNSELYEQAQRAILLRETILAVASHDLNNPLYAIGITADTLLDAGAPSAEGLLRHLTSIKRASPATSGSIAIGLSKCLQTWSATP